MPKYRKKPVVIEAFRWLTDRVPDWWRAKSVDAVVSAGSGVVTIRTLEGDMDAQPGDYIIQGVQGEIYPCKPDIFEQTYERVDDE
jgi:hypothetical protein